MIIRGIFYVVSRFPLHFMLYRGNFDYFTLLLYSTLGPMKCAKPNGDICHIYVLTKPTSLEFFLVVAY